MFGVEAIRTAMTKFGNKPLTGEQIRWGFEHLNLTEKRLDELGMKGFTRPITVTCENHEGTNGQLQIEQWDGTSWKVVSEWSNPLRDVGPPEDRGGGRPGRQAAGRPAARLLEGERGDRRPTAQRSPRGRLGTAGSASSSMWPWQSRVTSAAGGAEDAGPGRSLARQPAERHVTRPLVPRSASSFARDGGTRFIQLPPWRSPPRFGGPGGRSHRIAR